MFFKRDKTQNSAPKKPETPAKSEVKAEKKGFMGLFSRDSQSIESDSDAASSNAQPVKIEAPAVHTAETREKPKSQSWFARIKNGLARTSHQFAEGFGNLLLGKKAIDDELLEELETQLLMADVGIEATTDIIDALTAEVERKQLADSDALYAALQTKLLDIITPAEQPLVIDSTKQPYVILVVGVNGVGKTTTIGKLAYQLRQEGKSVMLAAGDTFRAAAVEQLQVWGERNDIHVVAQHTGADSASVIYDAIASAKSKQLDVVICDTAGRLHNKSHLMEELAKVKRVMGKVDNTAPHEVLLVLDAGTGQNAVNQAEHFQTVAGVTGLALTKLDGTAKGGVIFALSQKLGLPIRLIGVGEGIEDLQPFRAKAFVNALFRKDGDDE
ncbi:signal recognition particle-docking protein FtsY [Marinagarivorans algicola]|uniref:signal recognition particle-docking protein FtsY n=1 Tax=Marinagarivorans algicola TaxID=1513270 RepID=UPI0009EB8D9A